MRDSLDISNSRRASFRDFRLLQVFLLLLCLLFSDAAWAQVKSPAAPSAKTESAASTANSASANSASGKPLQYTLPNGLRLLLLEDHSFPVVSCFVWYKVGARNESAGATGLSHIVEHLLFQSVGHYRKGELGATIVRNGGQFNGFTSDDFTAFFETIHPSKLDLALRIESERMRSANFTPADFQEELSRVKSESERESKDTPATLAREVRAAAYVRHPYKNPTVGWPTDLDSLTIRDAKEFYDRFFHPNNATLVIVGDFRKPPVLSAVAKYFGAIPKSTAAIPVVRVTEPPQSAERRVLLHYSGKKDEVQLAYHGPSFADNDAPAMIVLEKLLNASLSGKLKIKLLDPKVCSYGKSAFELKRDPGLFTVSLSAPAGAGPQKVLEGWDALVSQLRTQPATDGELRRAKNQAEFAIVNDRDGPYRMGFQLGFCETLQSWQASAAWTDRLRAVTINDLLRVSKKYLAPENRVVGLLSSNATKPANQNSGAPPTKPPVKPTPVTSPIPKTPISRIFEHTKLLGYKDNDDVLVRIAQVAGTAGSVGTTGGASVAADKTSQVKSSSDGNHSEVSASENGQSADSSTDGESRWKHRLRRFKAPPAAGVPNPASVPGKPQFNMRILPPADESATDSTPATSPSSATPGAAAPATADAASASKQANAPQVSETPPAESQTTSTSPATSSASTPSTSTSPATTSPPSPSVSTSPKPTMAATSAAAATSTPTSTTSKPDVRLATPAEPLPKVIAASMPLIQRKILKNGTVVIVVESHLAPLVQINGAIRAGEVFDPFGKKGLSSLCAHVLNDGPSRPGRPQSMQQQEDLGLQPQAMLKFESSPETINFQTRCLSRDLGVQLNLLATAVKDPPLQEPDLEKAKNEFYSSIKNAEESINVKINRALLRSVIASNTSYYPIDPSEKAREVSQLKAPDVKDFLNQFVTPDSTVIVIAGDVTPDRAFALVERAFDGWGSPNSSKPPRPFPPATESTRKTLKASIPFSSTVDKAKTTVSIGRLLKVQSDDKDYSILLVSDCALNNHPIFSRMAQRINSEPGLANGLSFEDMESRFLPLSNMTSWSLVVPVEPNLVSRTAVAIQAEVKRFARTGMSDNELGEIKRYMSAALPVRLMPSTSEAAKSALNGYFQGTEVNFLGQLISSIRAVDLESVNKFIKTEFKPDQGVLIVAGSPEVIKQVTVSSASRTRGGVDSEAAPGTP